MFEELERCFEERKLRKTRPDFIKSKKSIESARACLEEAELDLKSGALRSADMWMKNMRKKENFHSTL